MSSKLAIRMWPALMITCIFFPGVSKREKLDNHKDFKSKNKHRRIHVYSWKIIAIKDFTASHVWLRGTSAHFHLENAVLGSNGRTGNNIGRTGNNITPKRQFFFSAFFPYVFLFCNTTPGFLDCFWPYGLGRTARRQKKTTWSRFSKKFRETIQWQGRLRNGTTWKKWNPPTFFVMLVKHLNTFKY